MRGRGQYIGFDRDPASAFSGVWGLGDTFNARKNGNWSQMTSTWNYSPMQDWYTTGSPNSWATNTASTLAQNTSYGPQARARSNSSQLALNGNWTLEFSFNKTGFNSSPYPGQHLIITSSNSLSQHSGSTTGKMITLQLGNAYGLYFYVYKGGDTQVLYNNSRASSTYAVAGYWNKVTFDAASRTLSWYTSTSTSKSDYSSAITYTYSESDFATFTNPTTTGYYIYVCGRGGTDGVRDVTWVAT